MKRKMRKFWTLNRHHAEGFTLIELIVVIAVIGILGGVGVPAYSGYVTRTQMGADQALLSEIKHALTIAMYDNYEHTFSAPVVVKLSTNGAVLAPEEGADAELVDAAMAAAFGANWEDVCKLEYDGWTVDKTGYEAFADSTYDDEENIDAVLDTVSTLGGHLSNFFDEGRNVPEQLQQIMNKYSATDSVGASNAAVLALANSISAGGSELQTALQNAMNINNCMVKNQADDYEFSIEKMMGNIQSVYKQYYGTKNAESGEYEVSEDAEDMVTLTTTATMYAYAEGYALYCAKQGDNSPLTSLSDAIKEENFYEGDKHKGSLKVMAMIGEAFGELADHALADLEGMGQYFIGATSTKDLSAFFAMMGAVDQSADTLGANLGSSVCFSDSEKLIYAYVAAGKALGEKEAGVVVNKDKSVVSYIGGALS